jgi:hypothetical protein
VVFTSAQEEEVIRLWDVRAGAAKFLYELSTGNNQVTGMEWDGERSVLYASTDCDYVDRMGNWTGYRRAKIPRAERQSAGEEAKDEQEDEEDGDDDDYARCWPRKAAHAEEYFGHLFDAGEHRICGSSPIIDKFSLLTPIFIFVVRYAFKEQPDLIVLPVYGDATATSRSSFW